MSLSHFILHSSERIISEWEVFARSCTPAANVMDLRQRRDHLAGMLKTIARDLETPQTKREQAEKSIGGDDAHVNSDTAANAHGMDRAASGFTPVQMVSEFRALRASILRLWSEAQGEFSREHLDEVTRFNEAIDQQMVESITRYTLDVDRLKDVFLGILGHDLRNPVAAIMTWASVMKANERPEWRESKAVADIQSSCARMDRLIGDLLDLTRSRLGAGIPIVRSDEDLRVACRHVIDELAALYPDRVVTVEVTGDLRGHWDGARIAQAMSNLLGNAFQHGAPDGPIQVALRGETDRVVLSVHNQGEPIPKRHLQAIFDPFRQLDPDPAVSSQASLGLGLYIVQAIVTAHGGSIEAESTDDGTTFTMRLPR
ncbi:MAG: HAMP domain-containing histidine kinase [Planctomycetes bacterium]|nr:HAMP domain-containing histidine kinase [Planctomycetota bacterium]